MGAEFHVDRGTDRYDEAIIRFSQFASAPKKWGWILFDQAPYV
jgi:hypothetical protein